MAPIPFKANKTHGQSLLGLSVLDIVRIEPRGYSPETSAAVKGTAEAVTLQSKSNSRSRFPSGMTKKKSKNRNKQ
jgi:hypothetical protein